MNICIYPSQSGVQPAPAPSMSSIGAESESYEKWCALVSNIKGRSISDCNCKLEKAPDVPIYIRKRTLPCKQETQANHPTAEELHMTSDSEITTTTNMSYEEGCTGITFDISEITFATDQDSNCSTQAGEGGRGEEEEEEEEEVDGETEESEEEFEDSDPECGSELSDSDQLEKNDFNEVPRKVRELCPDCGAFFYVGKTHTCEYKIKPFPCNVCGKRCKDEPALKSHSRIHNEDYQHFCKFCLASFKTRLDKLAHQKAHIPNEKPYKCPDCEMTFSKLRARNFHLKEHRGRSSVSCPHCALIFPSTYFMKRHIVVHTGVKQYVCEFCRRSFNQPGHLKSHLRLHTGEKPYQCQHCDKSYNHNVSLKSHVTRYHEGASDSGPSEHTKEKMEPPVTRIKIENENEMCTVDTEDTGTVVTELQEQPMKPIKKVYDRSMGRPIGRPKRNAATGETNSIPAVRGEAITAAEPSEEGHMKRTSSKSIKGEWSDKGPTSELTEEDEPEEHKGMRKSKRKASRRPKNFVTAEKDFNSDSDFDPVDTAKKRRTSRQKSGSTGGRRGRPRKNAVVE